MPSSLQEISRLKALWSFGNYEDDDDNDNNDEDDDEGLGNTAAGSAQLLKLPTRRQFSSFPLLSSLWGGGGRWAFSRQMISDHLYDYDSQPTIDWGGTQHSFRELIIAGSGEQLGIFNEKERKSWQ